MPSDMNSIVPLPAFLRTRSNEGLLLNLFYQSFDRIVHFLCCLKVLTL